MVTTSEISWVQSNPCTLSADTITWGSEKRRDESRTAFRSMWPAFGIGLDAMRDVWDQGYM